jgi:hypothetical protein
MEVSERWIDEKETSEISGRAIPTLRNDRSRGKGIPYYKVGRSVRYRYSDVIEFMEAHKVLTVN